VRNRKADASAAERDRPHRIELTPEDVAEVVPMMHAFFESEARSVATYQTMLWATQAALFGAAWALQGTKTTGNLTTPMVFAMVGIVSSWFFGWPSVYHAYNVDRLRDCMAEVCDAGGNHLQRAAFEAARVKWQPVRGPVSILFGHWFENIFISLVICAWTALLWWLGAPTPFVVISTVLAVGWLIYLTGVHYVLGRKPKVSVRCSPGDERTNR
jgi:hypothetical protein